MQEDKLNSKSKGLPKAAKFAVGCLLVLVVLGAIFSLFAGAVAKKLISGRVPVSFTDPKTGAKLDVGSNKIPDNFPNDFPIYPGSKVTSSLSGNGFWVTLSTPDAPETVISYYETNLKTNGWSADTTIGSGTGTNWVVSKGDLSGYLTVDRAKGASETTILIVLGVATSK